MAEKFCQTHWDKLRESIKASEVGHLIAQDGHQAVTEVAAALKGAPAKETFDPLIGAMFRICEQCGKPVVETPL